MCLLPAGGDRDHRLGASKTDYNTENPLRDFPLTKREAVQWSVEKEAPMLGMLFWIALIATIALAFASKNRWESYHRGGASRVELVNTIVAALLAGAGTIGVWIAKGVTRLP